MADTIITDVSPVTLAEYESLISDKHTARKVFLHTIRDYMALFDQAVTIPANDGMGDKGQIVTKYPEGELHGYNEGWGSEAVVGQTVRYTCCRRSSSSTIDKDEYNDQPEKDRNVWRLRRDEAFARGFARATARTIFYGDPGTDPNACRGIANIVTPSSKVFGDRCINAGGETDGAQTDVFLIGWDPAYNYLFFPEHGENTGGFDSFVHPEPVRVSRVVNDVAKHYWAMETDFRWDIGVAIYDPLTVVRICNIDTTKLSKYAETDGSPDLIDLFQQAADFLPDEYHGRCAFYAGETVVRVLNRQIMNKSNVQMTLGEFAGRRNVTQFGGIPVHKLGSDVIGNDGAVLTF